MPPSNSAAPKTKARREFSAGFLVFRDTADGRVWLILDYGKHWDYPKGHLEKSESRWQAAVRELREETGIRKIDRVGRFQHDIHYRFQSKKKGRVEKTVTYFLARTPTEAVRLSDEHEGYAWLPYKEALEKITFPAARNLLRLAHQAAAPLPGGSSA